MKVGDEVLVISEFGLIYTIKSVKRETKNYWVVGGDYYSKSNFRLKDIADWNKSSIQFVSKKILKEYREKFERHKIASELRHVYFDDLSLEQLKQIKRWLKLK